MKLTNNEQAILTSSKSQNFQIEQSEVAFKILSKNLYKNPLESFIREIISNAVDSHKLANTDKAVEVELPYFNNDNLIVRDFGVGLSNDEVISLYTTYFGSSKSDTNESIGGFGLGSKSPFAYTDSFIIKASKNGIKNTYLLDISTNVPTVTKTHTEQSDETGVEVNVPIKRKDFDKIEHIVKSICKTLDVDVEVNGKVVNDHELITYLKRFGYKWVRWAGDSEVVIGGITMPLTLPKEHALKIEKRKSSFEGLILAFDIGELTLSPNREHLVYDETTVKKIEEKIDAVLSELDELETHFIDTAKSKYELACNLIKNYIRNPELNKQFNMRRAKWFRQYGDVRFSDIGIYTIDDLDFIVTDYKQVDNKVISSWAFANKKDVIMPRDGQTPELLADLFGERYIPFNDFKQMLKDGGFLVKKTRDKTNLEFKIKDRYGDEYKVTADTIIVIDNMVSSEMCNFYRTFHKDETVIVPRNNATIRKIADKTGAKIIEDNYTNNEVAEMRKFYLENCSTRFLVSQIVKECFYWNTQRFKYNNLINEVYKPLLIKKMENVVKKTVKGNDTYNWHNNLDNNQLRFIEQAFKPEITVLYDLFAQLQNEMPLIGLCYDASDTEIKYIMSIAKDKINNAIEKIYG